MSAREGAPSPGSPTEDVGVDRALLDRAIGGWRGLIDSGVPAGLFVLVYSANGQDLRQAVLAALAAGAVIAVWRVLRREPLQQVAAGFAGLAISAFVATRTGRAQDFFVMGLVINAAYLSAFLVSILVRWPLLGVLIGYLRGAATGWRTDRAQYRAYVTASWVWVAMFGLRLAVQMPLYLAGAVGALGTAKIVMGWPLFLLTGYLTYRILHPVLTERSAAEPAVEAV